MGTTLKKEEYILYILNRLQPEKSDFRYLNKIAFLVEFSYLSSREKELSNTSYAAIDHGPVINDYRDTLTNMEKKGLIKIDGYKIRLLDSSSVQISKDLDEFASPLINKYSQMTPGELRALTHSMDSYLITTNNEKQMGKVIDKNLAILETIFDDNGDDNGEHVEVDLPSVDFSKLVPYKF